MTVIPTHHRRNAPQGESEISFAEVLEKKAHELAASLTPLPLDGKGLSLEYLQNYVSQHGITNLIILDQKVAGIEERGDLRPYGYEFYLPNATITVIDHHVRESSLSEVSTGNLVLEYLRQHPSGPPPGSTIAITHGDCDSVVSAGLMLGALPPLEAFGDAVLSADHTFEANHIGDMLQAIELIPPPGELVRLTGGSCDGSLSRSIELSFRNLGLLLQGKDLEAPVAEALQGRLAARAGWRERIERGEVQTLGGGTCICVLHEKPKQDPYPEFLKGLLPHASLVLVFHQVPEADDFMQVRAIGGCSFPEMASLGDGTIISGDLVPGFGGRRDAGSNRRGGISFEGDPHDVALVIDARLAAVAAGRDPMPK